MSIWSDMVGRWAVQRCFGRVIEGTKINVIPVGICGELLSPHLHSGVGHIPAWGLWVSCALVHTSIKLVPGWNRETVRGTRVGGYSGGLNGSAICDGDILFLEI